MAITELKINSIIQGQAPSQYFGQDGTFLASTAIDSDYPISSSSTKTSGFCVPIGYAKFSGSNVTASVVAVITNPKNTLTYNVLSNGRIVSYDSSQANETLVGTCAGGSAGGAAYYNNYIYIFGTGASHNDVSRYGPLNNSPTLVDAVWTGATLGSQAVLSNTTYPTIRSVSIPNHWGYVHGDNSLYFLDFESKAGGSYPGQGLVHRIHTKKTTDEGDTNDTTVPTLYGALRLPLGFYPTSICTVSVNIMVIGIYTTDNNISQGKAAFVMWDPTNTTSFYLGPIPLADTLATACLNADGQIYVWTGNAQNGVRLSTYVGGESVKDILLQEEGLPPLAGAVDYLGNRVVWGGFTTVPNDNGCVWAYGSKDPRLPSGLNNIAKVSAAGTTPIVTALKYVQQDSYKQPKMLLGWTDGTGSGIDKYSSSATQQAVIRWMFNVGKRFQIQKIRIPFAGAVAANTTIQPKIHFDDFSATPSNTLTTVNNTNYSGKRKVIYKGPAVQGYVGDNNFVLELAWTGTNPLTVGLPISVWVDIKDDEPQ